MNPSVIPMQDREWLKQLRKLKGKSITSLASDINISHLSLISVESGAKRSARPVTAKTVNAICDSLGIKLDVFFHKTDSDGRLVDKSAITDIITLYAMQGYKGAVYSEEILRCIFADEVAEYIIDNIVIASEQE